MANCSCVKGNFEILLHSLGGGTIVIDDFSDWMKEDYYTIPESYELEILAPNRPKTNSVTIYTNKRNKLTPSDIGVHGKNFTDGIYCFTLLNCGNTYKRNKLISAQIECCIEDAVSKLKNREEILLLDEIRLMLDSCRINTEIGNLTRAKEQYSIITKMLKRLNCNCN